MHTQSPKHVAIIMDGNRRWATERGLPKFLGHTEGAKNIKRIATAAKKSGISYLTLFTLSTENLKGRSPEELTHLFSLISKLPAYLDEFIENETKLCVIGDISSIPETPRQQLLQLVDNTKDYHGFTLTLAINYGGKDEIVRAINRVLQEKNVTLPISEELISSHLDTAFMPEPELLIRTGGNNRLSNFLLWQSAYTELYFTNTFWPAFDEQSLHDALVFYQNQKRNFGS